MIGADLTTRVVENALQASSLRQRVLAHNIANVNTPGFKRARVDFERFLSEALRSKEGLDAREGLDASLGSIKGVRTVETSTWGRLDGNNVDVELEAVQIAENQIWYAALTRQLSDRFARMRMVIHDGRR